MTKASSDQKEHMPRSNCDEDLDQHHAGYDPSFTVGNVNRGAAQKSADISQVLVSRCPRMLGILNTTVA